MNCNIFEHDLVLSKVVYFCPFLEDKLNKKSLVLKLNIKNIIIHLHVIVASRVHDVLKHHIKMIFLRGSIWGSHINVIPKNG